VIACKQPDQQWTQDKDPRTVILWQSDMRTKKGGAFGHEKIGTISKYSTNSFLVRIIENPRPNK
jgi:hypothetical protein